MNRKRKSRIKIKAAHLAPEDNRFNTTGLLEVPGELWHDIISFLAKKKTGEIVLRVEAGQFKGIELAEEIAIRE